MSSAVQYGERQRPPASINRPIDRGRRSLTLPVLYRSLYRQRNLWLSELSWAFLIYVAANVARAVAAIHEHGPVIGDVNPKNILVTRKATVYLLDVNSFQVSADGKTYRCEGGFPEYTPPELQGVAFRDVDRAQEHDCFGLAIVIFQLLFMGRHPFSGAYLGAGEMPLERAIREFRFAYGVDVEERKRNAALEGREG